MTGVSSLAIVLVAPQMGENIGAAARVMANFGLSDLRLVRPRDGWPNTKAQAMAAGALDGPVSAEVFETAAAACADGVFTLAATARARDLPTPALGPREAFAQARASAARGGRPIVLFGAEAAGLTNDEVALADAIVTYPVAPAFSSLNLAQSVAVAAYEWRAGAGDAPPPEFARARSEPARTDELQGLLDHMEAALDAVGFFFPPEKAASMRRNLRAAFASATLSRNDVQTLRGVIKALSEERR